MRMRSILFAMFFLGCGDRASLGDHGAGSDPLTVADSNEVVEPGPRSSSTTSDAGNPGTIAVGDIEYIEVDETHFTRRIRVDANCRVTDHTGLDAMGDPAHCEYLFAASVDPTRNSSCGNYCEPNTCTGTVRIHLNDGTDLVRDFAADRCSVAIPSLQTHKLTYFVWYGAGGGS